MIVGTEWLIEVFDADETALRDTETLREVFRRVIADLGLKTIGEAFWHQFGGEKGITGLVALTESHLACHTYPEHKTATFNLYCCKNRPEWSWEVNLKEMLSAESVSVQKIERGAKIEIPDSKLQIPNGENQNLKPEIQNLEYGIWNLESNGGEI